MPLVGPVIAVNARIAQELDDLLRDKVLAGELRAGGEDLERVGVGRHRGVPLERIGQKEIHAFERTQRAHRDRIAVLVEDDQAERGVVAIGPEAFARNPYPVLGQRAGQVAKRGQRGLRPVAGARKVGQDPGQLEDLEGLDHGEATVPAAPGDQR